MNYFVKIFIIGLLLCASLLSNFSQKNISVGLLSFHTVESDSMEPAIKKGSILISVKESQLKFGDIVTFKSPLDISRTITHRIYGIEDGRYITKGDHNNTVDAWLLKRESIVGNVKVVIPYLGYLITFIRTPLGLFLLIVLPLGSAVILEGNEIGFGLYKLTNRLMRSGRYRLARLKGNITQKTGR